MVEVPVSEMEMRQDPNTDLFSMHLSILAQVKNKAGTVIEHFSEDIPRHGALETIDKTRLETVTLQRHFIANPGEYVMEVAIEDRNNGKIGARTHQFRNREPAVRAML